MSAKFYSPFLDMPPRLFLSNLEDTRTFVTTKKRGKKKSKPVSKRGKRK